MTHKALSDDESDHESGSNLGQSRYAIVKEEWRSDKLIIWLRMIDLLACGEKWRVRLVAPVGNGRRLRVHSTRSKPGNAVIGLPENCYNPNWLKSLNSLERKLLNIKPAIDMTFTSKERSCAFIVPFNVYLSLTIFTGLQRDISHSRKEPPNPRQTPGLRLSLAPPAASTTGS
jgi:hypothetical protein